MKDSKRVFIPLTLDNSTKQFFSRKQFVGIAILIIALVGLQVLIFQVYDSIQYRVRNPWLILIPCDLIAIYFLVFLFRKIVLREDQMVRDYKNNELLQKTDLSFCWDIFTIKNNHIYYTNGTEAVVVRLTHGYILDRPADQKNIHREIMTNALGSLAKQGFSFIYFNREIQDPNIGPLQQTEKLLAKYRNEKFYRTASAIIKHTYDVCRAGASTEQEYYLILADSIDTIKRLDFATKDFINMMQGDIYMEIAVLNNDQIWEFVAEQYGLGAIDPVTLLNKKFEDSDLQMVEILEVNRAAVVDAADSAEEVLPQEEKPHIEDWLLKDLDGISEEEEQSISEEEQTIDEKDGDDILL